MEAALPLYGHEMGECELGGEIPIYAVPLAKFAVSFAPEKGEFIGKAALKKQFEAFKKIMDRDYSALADLPYRIQPIYLEGKGVLRKGFPVYSKDAWSEGKPIGYVTSGTMIPYFKTKGEGLDTVITEETKKRMQYQLKRIQDGSFAKEFIDDQDAGAPKFKKLQEEYSHPHLETVGPKLRAMFSWNKDGVKDADEANSFTGKIARAQVQ